MLAIAISLLFGLAAFAAGAVVHVSVDRGIRRARRIMAELAIVEARGPARITRALPRADALPPLFAAA